MSARDEADRREREAREDAQDVLEAERETLGGVAGGEDQADDQEDAPPSVSPEEQEMREAAGVDPTPDAPTGGTETAKEARQQMGPVKPGGDGEVDQDGGAGGGGGGGGDGQEQQEREEARQRQQQREAEREATRRTPEEREAEAAERAEDVRDAERDLGIGVPEEPAPSIDEGERAARRQAGLEPTPDAPTGGTKTVEEAEAATPPGPQVDVRDTTEPPEPAHANVVQNIEESSQPGFVFDETVERAQQFEQRVLEANPQLDEEDVAIDLDAGGPSGQGPRRFQARLTPEGRQTLQTALAASLLEDERRAIIEARRGPPADLEERRENIEAVRGVGSTLPGGQEQIEGLERDRRVDAGQAGETVEQTTTAGRAGLRGIAATQAAAAEQARRTADERIEADVEFAAGEIIAGARGIEGTAATGGRPVQAAETAAVREFAGRVDLEEGEDFTIQQVPGGGLQAQFTPSFRRELAETVIEPRIEREAKVDIEPGRDFEVVETERGFQPVFTEVGRARIMAETELGRQFDVGRARRREEFFETLDVATENVTGVDVEAIRQQERRGRFERRQELRDITATTQEDIERRAANVTAPPPVVAGAGAVLAGLRAVDRATPDIEDPLVQSRVRGLQETREQIAATLADAREAEAAGVDVETFLTGPERVAGDTPLLTRPAPAATAAAPGGRTARDVAVGGAIVTGAAGAAAAVDRDELQPDDFFPAEVPVTEEPGPPSELDVPDETQPLSPFGQELPIQPPVTDIPELVAPTEVGEGPRGLPQTDIPVPEGGEGGLPTEIPLGTQPQLVQRQRQEERRRTVEETGVPEEMIPDEPVTIGGEAGRERGETGPEVGTDLDVRIVRRERSLPLEEITTGRGVRVQLEPELTRAIRRERQRETAEEPVDVETEPEIGTEPPRTPEQTAVATTEATDAATAAIARSRAAQQRTLAQVTQPELERPGVRETPRERAEERVGERPVEDVITEPRVGEVTRPAVFEDVAATPLAEEITVSEQATQSRFAFPDLDETVDEDIVAFQERFARRGRPRRIRGDREADADRGEAGRFSGLFRRLVITPVENPDVAFEELDLDLSDELD